REIRARLEVAERLAAPSAALVACSHARDAAVRGEELDARRLGQDRPAHLLRLLGQPAAELRERGYVVALVLHRRRRRNAHGAAPREVVDGLAFDRPGQGKLAGLRAAAEEAPEPARVDDRAGE